MFDFIASLLSWLYDSLGNSYFLAIGGLTLIVLIVATPLTLQGTKSMLKMQLLQPEIKAIQNKYKADQREEMNKELMAYYQDNNINPVGGCVPMLFQIPVFLVLYRVIIGLTRRGTDVGFQTGQVIGEFASGASQTAYDNSEPANFNPAYLSDDSQMFQDLSSNNEMVELGFDISRSASSSIGDGLGTAWPYLLLVLIVGLTGWFQHRMIRARNTGASANPTQEIIMKVMPIFLPVFSFSLPAAIVIYFFISNLYRIGQQFYITKSMYSGEDSLGAQVRDLREADAKSNGKSGGNKGSNNKGGNNKSGNNKGSNNKSSNNKGSNNKNAKNGAKKPTNKSKNTSNGSRSNAPGRNSSGRTGSARSVEPRARKKKKR